MKTFYLVRHAKSSWDFPELNDIDRPLGKRGIKNAPEMGERLAVRNIHPEVMVSSPAVRALETAKVIAKIIGYPEKDIIIDTKVYHGNVGELLEVVQSTGNQYDSLMLFGHNPGFTAFANLLANEQIDNIPTCGIFACKLPVDLWSDVALGMGNTLFFDYPKKPFQRP